MIGKKSTPATEVFSVAERFVSINGEGLRAGRLAAFVRMVGCDLVCSWCDTSWANTPDCAYESLTCDQILDWVSGSGVSCVTLTGGEPTLQPHLDRLVEALCTSSSWSTLENRVVEIETNGAQDLSELFALRTSLDKQNDATATLGFTIDRKLSSSGMAEYMLDANYEFLDARDAVKFVIGSVADLEEASLVLARYNLTHTCTVLFSPVFGQIEPDTIVEFMKQQRLDQVRFQVQLHKIIWPHVEKGV